MHLNISKYSSIDLEMSNNDGKKFLTTTAQKRLLKDVKQILKKPLTEHGIYYTHDTDDIRKGYACIMGPEDTIYECGAYLFKFTFPHDYPFKPPKVKYCTNNGNTRFHPNLYRSGKVCLSILNTWKGEQWTSCQSIKSVLLTIVSILHNKPLLCEPGFTEQDKSFIPYNNILTYRNFETAIIDVNKLLTNNFLLFKTFIKEKVLQNKDKLMKKIDDLKKSDVQNKTAHARVYNMTAFINYEKIEEDFKKLIIEYEKDFNKN